MQSKYTYSPTVIISKKQFSDNFIKITCYLPRIIRSPFIKTLRYVIKNFTFYSGPEKKSARHILRSIKNFNTPILNLLEKSYSALFNNNHDESVLFFSKAIAKMEIDNSSKENWINSFNIIAYYYIFGKFNNTYYSAPTDSETAGTNLKKIFVSGMGWSGSGAMYDYINEFENIEAVKNEIRLLEGENSLRTLSQSLNSRNFKTVLLDFFRYSLLSYSIPRNSQDARCINSNVFVLNRNQSAYSMSCLEFISNIIFYRVNNQLTEKNFSRISSVFFDKALLSIMKNPLNTILLNNVIHIYSIEAAKNISNYQIFCFFRDPRANYVSLVNENLGFHNNPMKFVETYRQTIQDFSKIKESNPDFSANIHVIQFEKFILSEEYRQSIANLLNLDISTQKEYSIFKPWVSEKNVYNYKRNIDIDAINLIEKELSEYLWN